MDNENSTIKPIAEKRKETAIGIAFMLALFGGPLLFFVWPFYSSSPSVEEVENEDDTRRIVASSPKPPTIRAPFVQLPDDPRTTNNESNDQPAGHFGTATLYVRNPRNGNIYKLDADVDEMYVERIYFPKGGWVDFDECELDDDLHGQCSDENGREWIFEGLDN
jgi:hypothetical protein